ncbi:MAG TPA: patatin-like phospholipase family protein [Kofleriaceae bacterium]|nr:patatin-like phospholipase family protein [Kofleriaceae bacterium]
MTPNASTATTSALVFEGCGCRAAFYAGVAAELDAAGMRFPVAAGASSGSLCAAAVAAGHAANLPALWRDLAGRSVLSLQRAWHNRSIFDMSSIVRNGIVGLLGDGDMRNAPGEAIAAVTVMPRFTTEFLSSRTEANMINVLLGSCFIPGIYGRWITHQAATGRRRVLFDGGMRNNLPVEAATNAGATNIICVVSRPHPFANRHPFHRRWQPAPPPGAAARIHIIHPLAPLAVQSWDLDRTRVLAAIDAGRIAAARFLDLSAL